MPPVRTCDAVLRRPNLLEVIGAGLGRTGTHSLAAALETLGFGPCYHMHELRRNPDHAATWMDALEGKEVDWRAFFRPYRSTVEWPAVSFLPQILVAFPQARVILTLRDAEDWYESAHATIFDGLELSQFNPEPIARERSHLARRLILDGVFSGRHRDREHAIAVYRQHQEQVMAMVPPARLLRYRIAEGWGPLCAFLGVEEPEASFYWRNERSQFMSTEPAWAQEIRKRSTDTET